MASGRVPKTVRIFFAICSFNRQYFDYRVYLNAKGECKAITPCGSVCAFLVLWHPQMVRWSDGGDFFYQYHQLMDPDPTAQTAA